MQQGFNALNLKHCNWISQPHLRRTCLVCFLLSESASWLQWLIISSNCPVTAGPEGPDSNARLGCFPVLKPQHFFSQWSDTVLHDITAWGMNWHNSCVRKVTRLTRRDWVIGCSYEANNHQSKGSLRPNRAPLVCVCLCNAHVITE